MNVWNRLMYSIRAGYAAWRDAAFTPIDESWDTLDDRTTRYQLAIAMYSNQQYLQIVNNMATVMKQKHSLYRHTRGIYNPVYRTVEGYVASVYGGEIKQSLRGGAIPVETDDDRLRESIYQILQWSNWQQNKSLYVRTGATYGDGILKVVDDPRRQKSRLEVVDPRKIADIDVDDVGNVTSVVIQYQRIEDDGKNENEYTYTEVIDKEKFATYKDGKLHAYYEDTNGNPMPEWENIYGFVPMVLTNHHDIGQTFGANAFNAQIGKINYINDQASLLADQIRNAVQVMYHAKGLTKGQLATNSDEPTRDEIRLLYTPDDTEMIPLVPDIDITGASENLRDQISELEKDIPILSLHKIREGSNLSAPGVISAFSDAINQVKDVQSNYDSGLIRAVQMALTISGIRGYGGIPYNIGSYDNGDLDFTIRLREPIKNDLTKLERIQTLSALDIENPLTDFILEEMGYESDKVQDAIDRAEAAKADRLREMAMQQRIAMQGNLAAQGRSLRNGQQPGQQPAGLEQQPPTVDDGATANGV